MKTLERTPICRSESVRHKRKKGKPRFFLEVRYIGKAEGWLAKLVGTGWRKYGGYETERARDDALQALQKKTDWFSAKHEFRIPEAVA